jgi:thymidylate synthase
MHFIKTYAKLSYKSGEREYLELIRRMLKNGDVRQGPNCNTLGVIGEKMEFDLRNNTIPVLTTKKVAWFECIKELLLIIHGNNTSKDSRIKQNIDIDTEYAGHGFDQLQHIINSLNDPVDKYSRRLIMSSGDPFQRSIMETPSRNILTQFHVNSKNELYSILYQPSGEVYVDIPFTIVSYSILTCLIAQHCNLKPHKLIHIIGDAYISEQNVPALTTQLKLDHYVSPTIAIHTRKNITDYIVSDFKLLNYKHHPSYIDYRQ